MDDGIIDLGIDGISDPVAVGRGGFAVVYRARQEAFRRDIAVKVILVHPDQDTLDRFTREAVAMGALGEHPAILPLYDAGTTKAGQPYLLMPYMSGGSFQDALDGGTRLSWREGFEAGVVLAGALQAAHDEEILHRDLKPANVLLGRYGDPVLADFGIARIAGGPETASGVVTASLAHAAPEILDGQRPSEASDVYGLASTIYALIDGDGPHIVAGEESVLPLITRTMTNDPALLPGVPDAVNSVLQKGMARDPADRPASAAAFGALMAEALAGKPIQRPTPATDPQPAAQATRAVPGPPPIVSEEPERTGSRWLLPAGLLLVAVVAIGVLTIGGDDDAPAETEPAATEAVATGGSSPAEEVTVDGVNTATAIDLPPRIIGPPREDPTLTGSVDEDLLDRWANAPPTPQLETLVAGRGVSIPLPPLTTTARSFEVTPGRVVHLATSRSQIDPAIGLFGADGLFLRADDDTGEGETGAESEISLLVTRGGRHTVRLANLDQDAGQTTLRLDLLDPTLLTEPGRSTVTIDSNTTPVRAFTFAISNPGPLRELQVTSEALDPQLTIVDSRGRIRARVSGNGAARVTLEQLRMGLYLAIIGSDDPDYAGPVTLEVSG